MTHQITLSEAAEMTSRYRTQRPANAPICESFEIASVQRMLATPGAAYLRIYYGQKPDGSIHAILVAGDASGNDLLPASDTSSNAESDNNSDPVILEDSFRCPPTCPNSSPLNED